MRCPTCAAFVDDSATSCTSCGSEVAVAPPPLPPELAAAPPAEAPARRPESPSDPGAMRACDGCGNAFPSMELQRVHAQRLCAACADKAEATPARPSSGRTPKAPTTATKSVSRTPLVLMGAAVVVLASVAVYFTVLAPGAGGDPVPMPAPAPTAAPPPTPAPTTVALPPPVRQPTDLTFEGTLQPWEPDPDPRKLGAPRFLAFVDALSGRELRVSNLNKYEAADYTVGKRYRVSYRDVPSEDKVVEIKYFVKSTRIELVR